MKQNTKISNNKIRGIVYLLLLLIPMLVSTGLGYLFWKIAFSKVTSLHYIVGSTVAVYLIAINIVMVIVTPKFRDKHWKLLLVFNIIVYSINAICWSFFLKAASDFLYALCKVSLPINDFWIIYLIPCINIVATVICYALISIKDWYPIKWKLNLSVGVGAAASFGLTITLFVKQILSGGFMTSNGWFTLFGLLSSLITTVVLFFVVRKILQCDFEKKEVVLDMFWYGVLIDGGITSIFGVLTSSIALVCMILLSGGGLGGGGSGGRGSSKGSKRGLVDTAGNEYTANKDGTVTRSDGTVWVPTGNGTFTRAN